MILSLLVKFNKYLYYSNIGNAAVRAPVPVGSPYSSPHKNSVDKVKFLNPTEKNRLGKSLEHKIDIKM